MELLVWIIRGVVVDLLWEAFVKVCTWLDRIRQGRTVRLIVALALVLAAFFGFPVILGLLHL